MYVIITLVVAVMAALPMQAYSLFHLACFRASRMKRQDPVIHDMRKGLSDEHMTNEQQLLRNPEIRPTNEIIAEGLGAAYKAYTKLIIELEHYGITLMDWRFYNDGKAWLSKGEYKWTTPRGANKVKPIFWLSIWSGFFKVSFFFGSDIQEELLQLSISQSAKELINDAKPMGKTMRFIPVIFDVENESQLSDIYALSEFRKTRVK